MAKFPRPFLVEKRLLKLEKSFRLGTQKLRQKLIAELETIFDEAVKMARGEVTVAGKELTLRARRAWAKVASYTAQVIQGIAKGFDEHEICARARLLGNNAGLRSVKHGNPYKGCITRRNTVFHECHHH